MTRKMPTQKPGESEQVVSTPLDFLRACETRFGRITFDLAATTENCVVNRLESTYVGLVTQDFSAGQRRHFGPGSLVGENALMQYWPERGVNWLNPEYGDIGPWAQRAVAWRRSCGDLRAKLLLLVPASVGSDWWNEHVVPNADRLYLSPRLKFVGHTDFYPKDLALCLFDPLRVGMPTVECRWRWS